jgi:hypothetical protein
MHSNQPAQGPLRTHWEFDYSVELVLKAARDRVRYHRDRIAWWQQEMDQAEAKLKEKGFEYRRERHSLGEEVSIVGDPGLAKRVAECEEKIQGHRSELIVYEHWVRALETRRAEDTLALRIDDIVYFGL